MNAKAFFVTHYGLDCTKCIFEERLKDVLTIKAFYSASVKNFKQTKLQIMIAANRSRNETSDFVLIILHVCERKDINGSRFMAILRQFR